jgi:hypothetical protein
MGTESLLREVYDLVSTTSFFPYKTWMPPILERSREDFSENVNDRGKINKYVRNWFYFWDPWCGSDDTSKFSEDWNQPTKWAFSWKLGFTRCKMWSSCIRFEECMLCWSFYVTLMKEALEWPQNAMGPERAKVFAKSVAVMDHLIMCTSTWKNLEESQKMLPEFDVASMYMWRDISNMFCHMCIALNSRSLESLITLRKVIEQTRIGSISSVKRDHLGNLCDDRGMPLSNIHIATMFMKEKLRLAVLCREADVLFKEHDDLEHAEAVLENAQKLREEISMHTFGTGLKRIVSSAVSAPDEIDLKIADVRKIMSRLKLKPGNSDSSYYAEAESRVRVPHISLRFPDFIRDEEPAAESENQQTV